MREDTPHALTSPVRPRRLKFLKQEMKPIQAEIRQQLRFAFSPSMMLALQPANSPMVPSTAGTKP